MAEDKIKKLYDTFVAEGYTMESEEDFRKNITDPTKRRSAYDALVNDGYNMEKFEEFEANIGFPQVVHDDKGIPMPSYIPAPHKSEQGIVKDEADKVVSEQEESNEPHPDSTVAQVRKETQMPTPITDAIKKEMKPSHMKWEASTQKKIDDINLAERVGAISPQQAYAERFAANPHLSIISQPQEETLKGFIPNIKQSAGSLKEGVKYLAGEAMNVVTGSSQKYEDALKYWNEGNDISLPLMTPKERSTAEYIAYYIGDNARTAEMKQKVEANKELLKRDDRLRLIQDFIKEANGDVEKAKQTLSLRASEKTKGDIIRDEASYALDQMKQTEGFAGWVGNLIPQMVPSAVAVGLSFLTKNPAPAKWVGRAGISALTAATAGQSMKEARDYGASNAQTWAVGITDAYIEAVSEAIPFNLYTKKLFNGIKSNIKREAVNAVRDINSPASKELNKLLKKANKELNGKLFSGKNVKDYLTNIVAEGASEFTAEALQTITPIIYQNPKDYPALMEIISNGWEGAKAGLFMGGMLGGASKIAEHKQHRDRRRNNGFVEVAEVQMGDNTVFAELLWEDINTGNRGALINGEVVELAPNQVADSFMFTFEEFDRGAIEMEISQSYDEGQALTTPEGMNEAKLQYEAAAQSVRQKFELGEDGDVDAFLGDTPIEDVRRSLEMGGTTEEAAIKLDYLNAKATYDGMVDKVVDDVEVEVNRSNALVDKLVNKESGAVIPVTLTNGQNMFVASGNVVVDNEGVLDRDKTSDFLIVADASGNYTHASKSQIQSVQPILEAEGYKAQLADMIASQIEEQASAKIDGVLPFNMGDVYMSLDKEGNPHRIEVVANQGDGTIQAVIDDAAEPTIVTTKDVQSSVDAYRASQVQMRSAEQTQAEQADVAQIEEQKQAEEAPQEVSATSRVPIDEQGQLRYTDVDADTAWDALVEQANGNEATAQKVASKMVEKKQKALEDAQKADIAEGETPAEMIAAENAHNEAIAQAQAEMDKWSEIASTPQRRAEQARIQAEEAQQQAEKQAQVEAMQERIEKASVGGSTTISPAETAGRHRNISALDASNNKDTTTEPQKRENSVTPQMRADDGAQQAEETAISEDEKLRRKPLRKRINAWSRKIGIPVEIVETFDEVTSEEARQAIIKNEAKGNYGVSGWVHDGKVYIYMPHNFTLADIDATYIHEVVGHYGLAKMMGEKAYKDFCLKVWDMMPDDAKATYSAYEGVKKDEETDLTTDEGVKKDEETDLTTDEKAKKDEETDLTTDEGMKKDEEADLTTDEKAKAANEYIAHLAESTNLNENDASMWQKIVQVVKDFLRALNIKDFDVSQIDIENAIRRSYASLRANQQALIAEAVTNLEENGAQVDAQRGDVQFAVRDILGKAEREKTIEDIMAVTGRSRSTVEKWLKAEQSLAKIILDNDNEAFLDLQVDESVPSIWKNSDYPQGTVEFSNICRKRLPLTMIYQQLQKEYPDTVFDAATLETIRGVLKENGVDVACGLCFVEDRRQLLGEIGQGFIDALKGKDVKLNDKQKEIVEKIKASGDTYIPNLYELITLDGMKELKREHNGIANAFVAYNSARGMQAGRLFQAYSAYHREILKYNKKKIKSINDAGGLRIFSFSDFEAHHLIDLVQVLTDCASKGIKVQGYTKVPEFARAVKNTKMKLNRSLIAKGDGVVDADYVPQQGEAVSPNVINGKRLLLDTVEGIDVNHPDFFDSSSSANVGNILVGINDEHIHQAMLDPFVDYIIPFHTGIKKDILKKKGIDSWQNYKLEQLEHIRKENGKESNADKHGINIYTEVLSDDIQTEKQFVERYLEVCKEKGWLPKFHRFLDKDKNGDFKYTKGYYKLLLDFKLFNKNGRILPQEAVVPIFDNELNGRILEEYAEGERTKMPNTEVYDKVKDALQEEGKIQFRVADDIAAEQEQIVAEAQANGTYLKAPNGKDTNLTPEQWAMVRTKAFKNWFGDWENDPDNASKVIDANGEPKVVWHGGQFAMSDFVPLKNMHFGTKRAALERIIDREVGHDDVKVTQNSDGSYSWKYSDPYEESEDVVSQQTFETETDAYENAVNTLAKDVVVKPYFLNIRNIASMGDAGFDWDYTIEKDRKGGYEGIVYKNLYEDKGSDSYIAFEPNQIKSATENVGTFDTGNNDIRFRIAPAFYSNAERAVENIKQEKATPEQWLKMIEKNGGLKAGEDKWLGLSDWLKASDKKTLTKQEVLDFIKENQIQIEEVEYDEKNIFHTDEFQKLEWEFEDTQEEVTREREADVNEFLKRMKAKYEVSKNTEAFAKMTDAEHSEYEYLRRLETTSAIKLETYSRMAEKYGEAFEEAFGLADGIQTTLEIRDEKKARQYLNLPQARRMSATRKSYTTKGLDNKREIALVVPTIESWNESDEIHFGDAGNGRAIAWVRFGETTDAEGNRVLVIDEVQSKRHQEGREKGYAKSEAHNAFEIFREQMMEKYGVNDIGNIYKALNTEDRNEFDRLRTAANDEFRNSSDVPTAPFEKNWAELAMKRMLRYAAENGFDKVAWTTGEQQAERYDIGGMVTRITSESYGVDDNGDATRLINIVLKGEKGDLRLEVDKDGVVIDGGTDYEGKHLSEVVGKENAVRLMTQDTEISGNNLRIGGEGMRAFYDQMIPSFMNKYGKKWGVKVGEVTMPNLEENNTMHSVDVTPAMRESVMQGQPMFRIANNVLNRSWDGNPLKFIVYRDNLRDTFRSPETYGYIDERIAQVEREIAEGEEGEWFIKEIEENRVRQGEWFNEEFTKNHLLKEKEQELSGLLKEREKRDFATKARAKAKELRAFLEGKGYKVLYKSPTTSYSDVGTSTYLTMETPQGERETFRISDHPLYGYRSAFDFEVGVNADVEEFFTKEYPYQKRAHSRGELNYSEAKLPIFRITEYKSRFNDLQSEYDALDKNDEAALNAWRDKKVGVVRDYLEGVAERFGMKPEIVVFNGADEAQMKEAYDRLVESFRKSGATPPSYEAFKEHALDKEVFATYYREGDIITNNISSKDHKNTKERYAANLFHEVAHHHANILYSAKKFEEIWNDVKRTNLALVEKINTSRIYKNKSNSSKGNEFLAHSIAAIVREYQPIFQQFVRGEGNITADNVVAKLGYKQTKANFALTEILNRIKDEYQESRNRDGGNISRGVEDNRPNRVPRRVLQNNVSEQERGKGNRERGGGFVLTSFLNDVSQKGLRGVVSEDALVSFFKGVYNRVDNATRNEIYEYVKRNGNDFWKGTEQYLASLAENDTPLDGGVRDAFVQMLNNNGIEAEGLTDNDIRYMMWRTNQLKGGDNVITMAEDIDMRRRLGVDNAQPDAGGYFRVTEAKPLVEQVKEVINEYDNSEDIFTIRDVADRISEIINEYDGDEDTTELENILADYEDAQDSARRYGYRWDSGGEDALEEALRRFANTSRESNISFRVSDAIERDYPNWLEGTTTESGKHSTQVEGTRKTYKKVGDWIEKNLGKDVSILDASSGMGYGTDDLRKRGFNIEDVEPYQSEERKNNNPATYSSYDDINKQYDYIISNAVLNVIPDDWRTDVLHNMASLMADGGKMFINTRKAGEEKAIKDKIELDSPQEVLVKRNGRISSYQRFFTPAELKEWVESELGEGYKVERATLENSGTEGLSAVVVTKEKMGGDDTRFRITDRSKPIREKYDKLVNTGKGVIKATSYNFQEAHQDEMLSLKIYQQLVEEAYGISIPSEYNVYNAENSLSSRNKMEMDEFQDTYYERMMQAIDRIAKAGATEQEVRDYVIAKSGIERSIEFTVRDYINKQAEATLISEKEANEQREAVSEKLKNNEITPAEADYMRFQINQQRNTKKHDAKTIEGMRASYEEKRDELRKQLRHNTITFDEWVDQSIQLVKDTTGTDISDYAGLTGMAQRMGLKDKDWLPNARNIVNQFEGKFGNRLIDGLWDTVNRCNNETLRKLHQTGMLSQELHNKLRNQFMFYIPMSGFTEETAEDVYSYIGNETGAFTPPLKKAAGRLSESDDPFAIIGNKMQSAILQGNRNALKIKLLNLQRRYPTDLITEGRVWEVKQPDGTWEVRTPDIPAQATAKEVAAIVNEFKTNMQSLQRLGDARVHKGKANVPYKVINKAHQSQHQIEVRLFGDPILMFVNGNPQLAKAMNGKLKSKPSDNPATRWLGKKWAGWNRIMSANKTSWNPDFMSPNMFRDIEQALMMTLIESGVKDAAQLARLLPSSFAEVVKFTFGYKTDSKRGKLFQEFLRNGGETGYSHINEIEEWKVRNRKRWNRLSKMQKAGKVIVYPFSKLADGVSALNRIFEDATRFATYRLNKSRGKSISDSIKAAKDISTNFNKKGSGATEGIWGFTANFLRNFRLFFNPMVQGAYQHWDKMKRQPKAYALVTAGWVSMGFASAILNSMLSGDDDDEMKYENQNEYTRRNNLMIYTGDGYAKIPLAPIFREFYALGDILYFTLQNHISVDQAIKAIFNTMRSILSLEGQSSITGEDDGEFSVVKLVTPDSFEFMAEIIENEDFIGSPIYKDAMWDENKPEYQKVYNNTWEWAIDLSKLVNDTMAVMESGDFLPEYSDVVAPKSSSKWINPAIWQHTVEAVGGGIVSTIGNTYESISNALDTEEDVNINTIPIVRRFYTRPDERNRSRILQSNFYEIKEEQERRKEMYKAFRADTEGKAKEIEDSFYDSLVNLPAIEVAEKIDTFLSSKMNEEVETLRKQFDDFNRSEQGQFYLKTEELLKEVNKLRNEVKGSQDNDELAEQKKTEMETKMRDLVDMWKANKRK